MIENVVDAMILGDSPAVCRIREQVRKVAPTDVPVLIEGPTGAGKELVAQAIHALSRRRGAIVPINVAAIPETMFEDALFGHVRGAFTGAVADAPGYVCEANGGTLFLDEVSSLPLWLQPKLLRVLETRQYRPVGARGDRASDFRLVAASNTSLARASVTGSFRADLHHRLATIVICVPPLRERPEDVGVLARHFVRRFTIRGERSASLSEEAIGALVRYEWPGNVRELKSVVEAALALTERSAVAGVEIERAIEGRVERLSVDASLTTQRSALLAALERHAGDTLRVAEELRVNRATVYRWMQELGIPSVRRRRLTGSATSHPLLR